MSKMTGGISDNDEPATAEVQTLVEQVKDQITGKMNGTFEVFEAITFRSQVVAGRNYFVKVKNCFNVPIFFQSFSCTLIN